MESRTRVLNALNHQEPDRVPFDLGSAMMTGIHTQAYQRWRNSLGLPAEIQPELFEPSMQIVHVAEDFAERLQIDTRAALLAWPSGFAWDVHEDSDSWYYYDEWGYGLKMPKDSPIYYSLFYHPLQNANSIAELRTHPFPDPNASGRLDPLEMQIHVAETHQKAVVLNNICAGTMEVASWLRGIEEFMVDLSSQPEMAEYLLDQVVEFKLAYWQQVLARFGERVDVVVESDDLGGQNNLLISPRMYRRLIKPRHKRIFDFIHAHTNAKIFFHSCGAIRPLIPDLIEIGVDILNPVQFSANGMDAAGLKHEFGRDITLWGGGVETQNVLGRGTPQEVRDDVKRQLDILAPGGGYVFATVHNIQADVPAENLQAMWETLLMYGVY